MTTTPQHDRSARRRTTGAYPVTTTTTVYPTRLPADPDERARARDLLVELLDQSRVSVAGVAQTRLLYVSPQLLDPAARTVYLRAAVAIPDTRGAPAVVPVTEQVALVLGQLFVHLNDTTSFVNEALQMPFVDTIAHAIRLLAPALTAALQLDRPLVVVVF